VKACKNWGCGLRETIATIADGISALTDFDQAATLRQVS